MAGITMETDNENKKRNRILGILLIIDGGIIMAFFPTLLIMSPFGQTIYITTGIPPLILTKILVFGFIFTFFLLLSCIGSLFLFFKIPNRLSGLFFVIPAVYLAIINFIIYTFDIYLMVDILDGIKIGSFSYILFQIPDYAMSALFVISGVIARRKGRKRYKNVGGAILSLGLINILEHSWMIFRDFQIPYFWFYGANHWFFSSGMYMMFPASLIILVGLMFIIPITQK